jgi:DNA-binding Lrp family transcriptional regulator
MKPKQNYYMVIPAIVWNAKFDSTTILLYGHISTLANKNGYAHASNSYFEKVLNVSTSTITRKLNELENADIIKRTLIYNDDKKTIKERRIYLNIGMVAGEHTPIVAGEHSPIVTGDQDNNTSINNTSINIIDDVHKKMFFKLVEMYPNNRIGNRQHGLKKWLQLSEEDMKLALLNLKEYLNMVGPYSKSLQNYIIERCFTKEWLAAEKKTKQNKNSTNIDKTIGVKKFNTNYGDI